MVSYIEQTLTGDERVLLITKPSQRRAVLISVVLFLLGFLLLFFPWAFIPQVWLLRYCSEIGITTRRVVWKTGILSRITQELTISKLETVHVSQGIIGRMLGYGNIVLRGTGSSPLATPAVDDPIIFRRVLGAQTQL